MAKRLLIVFVLLATRVVWADGTVNFNNAVVLPYDIHAPVLYGENNGCGAIAGTRIDGGLHPTAMAALYAGSPGALEADLVLVGSIVGFRSGLAAGYFSPDSHGSWTKTISFIRGGGLASLQVRAWDACDASVQSYEQALVTPGALVGKSSIFDVVTGNGGSGAPTPPADMVGLDSFTLYSVPEPSGLSLIVVAGCGVYLVWRRRTE
jgi:hypothetical protein